MIISPYANDEVMYTFIRKYSFSILVLFLAISSCAFFFLEELNLQLNPRTTPHKIFVTASYRNALPDIVERNATTPLESVLATIQGIDRISSRSGLGSLEIELDLDQDLPVDMIRFEVANRIRQVFPKLPEEVSYPIIRLQGVEGDERNEAILTYSLYATDAPEKIARFARDQMIPYLSTVTGVNYIQLSGYQEPEWVIAYDPDRMKARSVVISDIENAIQSYRNRSALGSTWQDHNKYNLMLETGAVDELRNLLIRSDTRGNIYLQDVASIKLLDREVKNIYRINGRTNVRLRIIPEQSANHLVTAAALKSSLEKYQENLPPSYELLLEYDGTEFLKEELDKIKVRSLLSLGLLLLFVVLVYRNLQYTFIILMSLAVNLAMAIIVYHLLDVNINLYALAAITISFGILIDNTLVMIHHIKRHANIKVYPSLVSATLTTIASLSIIYFLPELWRQNLLEFARVIVINLSISLLVSLLLVPSILQLWRQKDVKPIASENQKSFHRWNRVFSFLDRRCRWVIAISILTFGLPVFLLPANIKDWAWYNTTLGSDTYRDEIKPYVDRVLGGTFRLFYRYVYESGQFRENQETVLYANTTLPDGTSLAQTDELCRMVENYLAQFHPNQVKNYILNIYNGESASFRITFTDANDYAFPYILKNRLTTLAANLGGANWSIYGVGRGFSNASGSRPPSFRVTTMGYNLDQLEDLAGQFAERLLEHPRIQEVNTDGKLRWWEKDKSLFTMDMDKRNIAKRGFQLRDVYDGIRSLSPIRTPAGYTQENVPISLIRAEADQKSIWNLKNEMIGRDSLLLNLKGLTQISKRQLPNTLHKENQQYVKSIEWEYTGSERFGSKYLDEVMENFTPTLPLGYTFTRSANRYFGRDAQRQYGLLFLVGVLIFMICAIHFESFKMAFTIILMIPISFIGIFLTFYLFDFPFDQGGYTSFILLSGITVNSMILILSDYMQRVKESQSQEVIEEYTHAFLDKITPILLTIFSTIIGLIPFLVHGSQEPFWYSLAIGTMGGLLFSLFAICFIMPAFVVMSDEL